MSSARSLPVVLPNIPHQRWSCHSCGNCCRTLVGHLTEQERFRLDEQAWERELGIAPYVRLRRGWALNKRPDGACVFLDEQNRCRIHARYGESAKPVACRIFPFSVRLTERGWQAAFRFDCPSAARSQGLPLSESRRWLAEVMDALPPEFAGLDIERGVPSRTGSGDRGATAAFRPRLWASPEEVETLVGHLRRWFRSDELPLDRRVEGAAHLAATLHGATLAKTRGPRFAELLDLLVGALASETAVDLPPATARQHGMLRQLAFVHAEHATLAEATGGIVVRMKKRWAQLRASRRLRKGTGEVPRFPGFEGVARLSDIERVSAAADSAGPCGELLLRYVTARIESRSIFGTGYYGWPIFLGLGALCGAIASAGWLARYRAACRGSSTFDFEDVATAIGVVDRAATRLPALGTFAERARMTYLFQDHGLRRLLRGHRLAT